MAKINNLTVQVGGEDGFKATFNGRAAEMLVKLRAAGPRGCTPHDFATGVRVADSIFKLRQAGLSVETVREAHGGDHPGSHARYVLRSPVEEVRA